MREFRLTATGEVVTELQYRERFPEMGLPPQFVPDDADLVYPVPPPPAPEFYRTVRKGIEQDSDGRWVYSYSFLRLSEAEINHEMFVRENKLKGDKKFARATAVKELTVTTASGNVFDGDEVSQNRMVRAITALSFSPPGTTVNWILANNTVVNVTAQELGEALALAGAAQADLWVKMAPSLNSP